MTRTRKNTNKGRTRTSKYRNLTDEEIAELLGVEYTSPEYRQKHGGGGSE
jgi:DNA polymerase/3'-5' exonuclease PolX